MNPQTKKAFAMAPMKNDADASGSLVFPAESA